jgi:hypothetical protein
MSQAQVGRHSHLSRRSTRMAHNFKIFIHRKIDNLYIRPMGDFDGSSAWELINAIRENLNNSKFIQIDTSKLKKFYPFGREVFKSNFLNVADERNRVRFSGPDVLRIAPYFTNSRRA